VIEVAFLNGVDTPAVLQAGPDYQFDRLGISIRGTMPFGVNQQQLPRRRVHGRRLSQPRWAGLP
jgi:hypothetical protein